ncbi:hypothetical protein D9613_011009 [Agrocybe pediades]|uniref:F-box domain-containing protein n=1 Tax=Agrocybe pediades TaxID=84607 RepID=A0A8H4VK83_9AGAR|nr:hypothetical protein D9613_011009 [Agrocybe pediades]
MPPDLNLPFDYNANRLQKRSRIAAIQKEVGMLAQQLSKAWEQLVKAEENMRNLELEHRRIKEVLNAALPPITSLPIELLLEIFLFICESRDTDDAFRLCGEHPPQFVIGGVCRAWRRIAWSTPRVWSTIAIEFCRKRIDTQNQLLQEWIDRLGSSLLQIYLDSENHYKHGDMESDGLYYQPPYETFAIICAVDNQWQTFKTRWLVNLGSHMASGNIEAPCLQDLHLHLSERHAINDGIETVNWDLGGSHCLTNLHLHMYHHSGLTSNWQTLTHLRVCMDPPDYIHVLRECTALESFTVAPGGEVDAWMEDIPPNNTGTFITLPSLNHVYLWDSYGTIQAFCDYITAPGLKVITLKLDYDPTEPMVWSESVIQFVRRSSCFLKNLELENMPASCIRGLLELENMKTIARLDVSLHIYLGEIFSESIINMLNPSIHTSCLADRREGRKNST